MVSQKGLLLLLGFEQKWTRLLFVEVACLESNYLESIIVSKLSGIKNPRVEQFVWKIFFKKLEVENYFILIAYLQFKLAVILLPK